MTDYVSNQSQYVCGSDSTYIAKALASTTGWSSITWTCTVGNNPSANNATGFSALPAGYYNGSSTSTFSRCTSFWSTTTQNDNGATHFFWYNDCEVYKAYFERTTMCSVRCLLN